MGSQWGRNDIVAPSRSGPTSVGKAGGRTRVGGESPAVTKINPAILAEGNQVWEIFGFRIEIPKNKDGARGEPFHLLSYCGEDAVGAHGLGFVSVD